MRCCKQTLFFDESSNKLSHILLATLGNEKLHHLLSQGNYELRMDMSDFTNATRYVKYANVSVDDEHNKYRIHLTGYSGNVGKCFYLENKSKLN